MTEPLSAKPVRKIEAPLGLLERLCNANGVSGDEGSVRRIVLEEAGEVLRLRGDSRDNVKVDAMGNVLVTLPGQAPERLRVMLAAHMDEVGFMITNDEGDGIFRFEMVGGLDPRQLAGKPVQVGAGRVPGVIGARPIHLTDRSELSKAITLETLRIDVGPDHANQVQVGDWAAFATSFRQVGPSLFAKALDDRLGVATLLEIIKHAPQHLDLLAAFTVQEEVGLRGARVAAFGLQPDLAIVLDCTPANDLPAWDAEDRPANSSGAPDPGNARYNTRLDAGPAIYMADGATISDPRLVRYLMQTGDELGIPYQRRQPGGGGTDAGAIHKQRAGIPSVSVSVPGRYAHSAVMMARLADWENTISLVMGALERLTHQVLSGNR